MEKVRIGNDLKINFSVYRNGEQESFDGATNISTKIVNESYNKTIAHTYSIVDNVIQFNIDALELKQCGKCRVFISYTKVGDYTVDSPAFELVQYTEDTGGTEVIGVEIVKINISGDIGINRNGASAYEVWESYPGNEGKTIEQYFEWLRENTTKIDLDGLNSNIDKLHFKPDTLVQLANIGDVRYSQESRTLEVKVSDTVSIQLGQEMQTRVKNDEAIQINNGQMVYINSAAGANPLAKIASTSNPDVAQKTFGMATENIPANGFGAITTEGLVRDINTSAFTEGSMLWLGTNGSVTNIEPTAPTSKISVGMVLRSNANNGVVYVKIRAIARNQKLSDVYAPTLTGGDILRWNSTTLRFETFNITSALNNKVDTSRTITAGAGLTGGGSLSADRTINVATADDSLIVAADNIKVNTNNTLTSTSTTQPLSANQGKVLNEKVVQVETDLNDLNVEANVKINNLSGQFNDTYKQIDGLHNKAIRITGLVETNSLSTRECIVKVDVSAYQEWKMTYPQVNTGTDTRNTLAFYSEDVDASIGSSTSLIQIYGRSNPTKFTQVEIPLNAVCALIYVLDYSSDIELSFISNEDALNLRTLPSTIEANKEDADKKNVSVITDVNNLTTNVIDKTQSLIDFLKLVDGEEYTIARTNESIAFSVENVDDDRIKKVFKFANTSAAQVNSFNPNLYFFIPYNEYYTLSFWAGMSDEQANSNPYLLNLEGRVLTTAAYRDGAIATQTRLSFVPLNKKTAAIYAIDNGGTYDLVANGLQNRIASSGYSTAYDSISALLTDYIVIDGVTLFHYEVKLSGIPSYHFMAAEFINSNFNWAIGCKMYVGGVMLFHNTTEDTKEKIYQDNINDVTKENDFNKLQYLESYKLDNDCVDQFEGNGVIKFMQPDFSGYTTKNLHTPFKLITKYDVTRVQKTITNPYSGEKFLMDGYKFHNSNDSAMSVYKSGAQTDYEGTYNESGDNPIFYTSVDTMTTMENPCLQFWIDRSELNGNSLERVYNFQIVRMNIQTARKGMLGNIATNPSALNTWTNIPPTVEIVDVVGDMVCIRAKSLKNYANRWCIWSISGNDVTSVTIYNPTLINSEVIDPYHRYTSISEKNNSQWRGKKITLIGDSQYNNGVVAYKLAHEFGANVFDVHYGGHRLSIGGNYSTNTGVSNISHSWFYQESYRKLVLDNLNVDAFILTFSTNDGFGDADWNGTIDENKIALVENNYPTYVDIINEDATYTSKLALFNALSDAQKNDTFSFVGCYCSYIKQILEKNPYSKLYICSVPITCTGYLTGTSVPDPSGISDEIGVWGAGYTPDIARTNIEDGFLNKDEQIKAIAKRYHAQLVDFRNECGMTYENFIYHCIDGTHWHEETSYKCAESLIRSME